MKRYLLEVDDNGTPHVRRVDVVGDAVVPSLSDRQSETDHERRVRERHENLQRNDAGDAARVYLGTSGLFADDLKPADLVYMRHVRAFAQFKLSKAGKYRNQDVYRVLLSGTNGDINRAINGMDRADVQGELSKFNADPDAWVAGYENTQLTAAFHEWLAKELA
jgi:membrane carboxypeptidase/penicillin-binding protein